MLDEVWENKKLKRYSKEYYEWLLKVMKKKNLDYIWVIFYKNKNKSLYGKFEKERCIEEFEKQGGCLL